MNSNIKNILNSHVISFEMTFWALRMNFMKSIDFLEGCLKGDRTAWNQFFISYDRFILKKIKQSFVAMGNYIGEEEIREAYDYIVDQFLYGKILKNYKTDQSFDGYIKTVVRRKTIDWLRKKTSSTKLYGEKDSLVATLNTDTDSEEHRDHDAKCTTLKNLTMGSAITFKLYLIRYYDFNEDELAYIEAEFSIKGKEIANRMENLRSKLAERFTKGDESFFEISFLYAKWSILESRKEKTRSANTEEWQLKIDRKRSQYEKCLIQYKKRGFEELPRQHELCEILGCNRRVFEKMVHALKQELQKIKNQAA